MNKASRYADASYRVAKLQLLLGILSVIVSACITKSSIGAISAVLGGLIALLSTLLYTQIAWANGCIAYPTVALRRHKIAMLLRFICSFILFALVAIFYKQCNFMVLLISYVVVYIGGVYRAAIRLPRAQ